MLCLQMPHDLHSHLAAEAADEFKDRVASDAPTEDLQTLAAAITPYFMAHNAEADACDLLMEVINRIIKYETVH